jgi:hypothetical protein
MQDVWARPRAASGAGVFPATQAPYAQTAGVDAITDILENDRCVKFAAALERHWER